MVRRQEVRRRRPDNAGDLAPLAENVDPLAEQDVNLIDLDIAWIPGPAAIYPTPTPVPTIQITGDSIWLLNNTVTARIRIAW